MGIEGIELGGGNTRARGEAGDMDGGGEGRCGSGSGTTSEMVSMARVTVTSAPAISAFSSSVLNFSTVSSSVSLVVSGGTVISTSAVYSPSSNRRPLGTPGTLVSV